MARERMAKLLNYCHFVAYTGHIFINVDIIKIWGFHKRAQAYRYLGSSPSDEDLELTVRSAML